MKMRTVLYFLVFLSLNLSAQRIQNFFVFNANNQVGIRFTIGQGPQCSGYTIFHSTDSINFFQIYDYVGVCGDQNAPVEYSYTHSSPAINQVNYYKVTIFPTESSPVARIFVSALPNSRVMPFPNPITNSFDLLGLKFFNITNTRMDGFIFNQFGNPLRVLNFTTLGDLYYIPVNELENGLYILWVSDGLYTYHAKFIIHR
jgi:hypothetical protein